MEVDPFEWAGFTVEYDEVLFAPFALPRGVGFIGAKEQVLSDEVLITSA